MLLAQGVQLQHITVSPEQWACERHKGLHAGGTAETQRKNCIGCGANGAACARLRDGRRLPLHDGQG